VTNMFFIFIFSMKQLQLTTLLWW